ncbi:hypothetical protein N658DRAFT_484189 [Parathielavia hyrcaniae]|uniref:Uncharacterized protein n=1 Tax=Parathielavia hyrcaniae TaxID=113614 RepID=A0AAN6QB09_9PEZI|nr:hypothetical protein N658DRAFT_484189 [Parathielavia hyrcaniae]
MSASVYPSPCPGTSFTFLILPLELRLEIYTYLLVLPPPPSPEQQQAIYRCSYPYSPPSSPKEQFKPNKPPLHPEILAVNRQINIEATPLLYSRNTFSAHPTDPTQPPTLYHPSYPSLCRRPIIPSPPNPDDQQNHHRRRHPKQHLIKRWHLCLRLDTPLPTLTLLPNLSSIKTTLAFTLSHADDLTLHLWTATFMGGVGADLLRQLEGVRGVRRVRVTGLVLPGFAGL